MQVLQLGSEVLELMGILALDLGTHTGWAYRSDDGQITHGVIYFKPNRFEGGGMRYLRFKEWLTEIRELQGNLSALYFEEVRGHKGTDAAHVYGGFLATLTAWCEAEQVPYEGVPVGVIKRYITGRGNASKLTVMGSVNRLGHRVTDDNEADAIALLYWVLEKKTA